MHGRTKNRRNRVFSFDIRTSTVSRMAAIHAGRWMGKGGSGLLKATIEATLDGQIRSTGTSAKRPSSRGAERPVIEAEGHS